MLKKILVIILLPLFLAGCGLQVKKEATLDGGVWLSQDGGTTWAAMNRVATVSEAPVLINTYNINFIKIDPTDSQTIYTGTREKGLYVSWDGAQSWLPLLVSKGEVVDLGIDYNDPCRLYAATSKNIFKSENCGRRWNSVFFEKRAEAEIRSLSIDPYETKNIILGMKTGGSGEIIWSQDAGDSWQLMTSVFTNPVHKIFINPKDTRLFYAALDRGFWRSTDKGVTWENLTKTIRGKELAGAETVYDLYFLPEYDNGFIVASKYGLLLSQDGGNEWQAYILLQQPNKSNIKSLAVDPKNSEVIYYGTKNGIYKTVDGGGNWITIDPPSKRWITNLVVNPDNTEQIYLGVWSPPQK